MESFDSMKTVRDKLKGIRASQFLRHVATVSGGQMVAAAIPILTAPILGRIYSPADYGPLGAYLGFAAVLGAIATWQYSQAIIISRRENVSQVVLQLCLVVSLLTAVLSIPLAIWLGMFSEKVAGRWFLFLPVSVILAGAATCLAALANRWQLYRRTAVIQWIPVTWSVVLSIALGMKGHGAAGLLIAYLSSQVIGLFLNLWVVSTKVKNPFCNWSWKRIFAQGKRHRRFAIFTTPTGFIGSATLHAPTFALTSFGLTSGVGAFSRANQLLAMPLNLIGGAVAQVFQRRASLDFVSQGHCRPLFAKTFWMLFALGSLPTLLLALTAPNLFTWYLGPSWEVAGHIARLLAPMLLLRVICSPLSTIFYVVGAQRLDFALTLIGCGLTWGAVLVAAILRPGVDLIVGAYSVSYSVTYVAFLVFAYRLSVGSKIVSS